jgi:hypothetical protein
MVLVEAMYEGFSVVLSPETKSSRENRWKPLWGTGKYRHDVAWCWTTPKSKTIDHQYGRVQDIEGQGKDIDIVLTTPATIIATIMQTSNDNDKPQARQAAARTTRRRVST